MEDSSPDKILFTDDEGNASSLEDIIADGLDGKYEGRIPALVKLSESGNPYQRLMACIVLTSWGHAAGFKLLISWASNPNSVPWVQEPVSVDRIYGANDAFENLADALKTSYWNDPTLELQGMQRKAAEALLNIYPSYFFGQTLTLALLKDPFWKNSGQDKIVNVLESCMRTIQDSKKFDFDLPYQTACLLVVLACSNDDMTAEFAERLITQFPEHDRMFRELASALGEASGQATWQTLNKLKCMGRPTVAVEVTRVISLRQSRIKPSEESK